jgi:hypothetical protein
MGFLPREVDRMTLWQFNACVAGYAAAHGGKRQPAQVDVDDEQLRAMGIEGF